MKAMGTVMIVAMALVGCGPSAGTSASPRIAERADVIVTVDGGRHTCVVALFSEQQGSIVPCGDVVSFVKDELRVASGAVYDVRIVSSVDKVEIARVAGSLNAAGYRFIGGRVLNP